MLNTRSTDMLSRTSKHCLKRFLRAEMFPLDLYWIFILGFTFHLRLSKLLGKAKHLIGSIHNRSPLFIIHAFLSQTESEKFMHKKC